MERLYTELYYEPRASVREMLADAAWVPEMTEFESSFLCGLIRQFRPHRILEVGVAAGGTTAIMLECIRLLGLDCDMYSVDVSVPFYRDNSKHSGYIAEVYMTALGEPVRHEFLLGKALPHVLDRFDEGTIDMVVLDTMHILPGELLDYLAILPRLAPGAVICLHDISLNQLTENHNIATNVLYSNMVGKRIFNFLPQPNLYGATYPNIGAMQVTENTFTNIDGVFHALMLNWAYMPSEKDIGAYRAIYEKAYGNEMMQIFENALLYNSKHEQYVFPFEQVAQGSKVVLYGAGNVGRSYYRQVKDDETIKLVGWVDSARREPYEGFDIASPDDLSGWDYDYVIIAVWPEDVAQQIREGLLTVGVAEEKIVWVQQG